MRKNINSIQIKGRIFGHKLEEKVSKKNVNYIAGTLNVAVDEEGLNIVTIDFRYVAPFWGNTQKANPAYNTLKNIIANGKTWSAVGKENATMISIDGNAKVNDFVNNEDELVSYKMIGASFINIINSLPENDIDRHKFTLDMIINETKLIEADEERHIPADYLSVRGIAFDYNPATKANDAIIPIDLVVKDPMGIKVFEDMDISAANIVYTKVWGTVNGIISKVEQIEESAFGEASVRSYDRTEKFWEITGVLKESYDFGDEKVMTKDELEAALQNREIHKAEVRKNHEEYVASLNAATPANSFATAATSAAAPSTAAPTTGWKF